MVSSNRGTRHALLIGIDRYPRFPEQNQLQGCVHDIELMAGVLEEVFQFERIRCLTDEGATREGIASALDRLASEVEQDDVVVVHYSGHGSRRHRPGGASADGHDESLVPHDSGRGEGENRDIYDFELRQWLGRMTAKTPFVTLIFDACHAGSLTRDLWSARVRSVPAVGDDAWLSRNGTDSRSKLGTGHHRPQEVIVAACAPHERACELKYGEAARPHGALTFFLCQELRRSLPGDTYRDLFERFAHRLAVDYPGQHPRLMGSRDREIFGLRTFQPMRFVPVLSREGQGLTLGAGAAHGLAVGSEWTLYPPGTAKDSTSAVGGRVTLSRLDAVESLAVIDHEEANNPLAAGWRAVQSLQGLGESSWSVALHPSELGNSGRLRNLVERLADAVSDSPLLRWIDDPDEADVRIRVLERVPKRWWSSRFHHDGAKGPCWMIFRATGDSLMPPRPLSWPLEALILDLEQCVRFTTVLRLANPNPSNPLRNKLELELLRRPLGCGAWQVASVDWGDPVFKEGDGLALRLINRSDWPLYPSVLDFGTCFGIDSIYPMAGFAEPLLPGRQLEIGLDGLETIEVFVPDELGAEEGVEYLKLFATTGEADFSGLTQGGVRDPVHPLEGLLRQMLAGGGWRDLRKVAINDWTSVTRGFRIRRRSHGSIDRVGAADRVGSAERERGSATEVVKTSVFR